MAASRKLVALRQPPRALAQRVIAIIDIGSNSVRLVVYRGLVREPPILFNEKVLCGLGANVARTGKMDKQAMGLALATLARFAALCDDMAVDHLEAVATSAVREARNGAQFLADVERRCGFRVRVLTGEEEARCSALGVALAIPGAQGIMGDLGGGSLELVALDHGRLGQRASLPIGPLSLLAATDGSAAALEQTATAALQGETWLRQASGQDFYLVGGSWRALAHLHMHLTRYPLPIIHGYAIPASDIPMLIAAIGKLDRKSIKAIPNLSERRYATLLPAALVLKATAAATGAVRLVSSAHGLREGLLAEHLSDAVRAQDPFIEACRAEGMREGRFPEHGDILMQWMDPLFSGESQQDRRLRLAACLLCDVSWRGHPDFRAERAVDISLFGNWVGVDARDRSMVATALMVCYGASVGSSLCAIPRAVLTPEELARAEGWGRALRLGQRLTAGTAAPLTGSVLRVEKDRLVLHLAVEHQSLYGEVVARRLESLATFFGLRPRLGVAASAV